MHFLMYLWLDGPCPSPTYLRHWQSMDFSWHIGNWFVGVPFRTPLRVRAFLQGICSSLSGLGGFPGRLGSVTAAGILLRSHGCNSHSPCYFSLLVKCAELSTTLPLHLVCSTGITSTVCYPISTDSGLPVTSLSRSLPLLPVFDTLHFPPPRSPPRPRSHPGFPSSPLRSCLHQLPRSLPFCFTTCPLSPGGRERCHSYLSSCVSLSVLVLIGGGGVLISLVGP